jgi:hypothetical protein
MHPFLVLWTLAGCAKLFPGRVADGVAQLTVRDLGGLLVALNNDTSCGFSSASVVDHPVVSGELGEEGTATWTVEGCTIDLGPEPVVLHTNCNDVTTEASGSVTVTARKVVTGHVTGDPATPVIPTRPDAASFYVEEASFTDFRVTKSNSDNSMRILQGSLSAVITPRLAADDTNAACSITTPNVEFEDIRLGPSRVEVFSGNKQFEVEVGSATLSATNGVVGEHVNRVEGTVEVWKHTEQVSLSGPSDGLDPDYDPATFEASYACTDGLALPVSYECPLEPKLVESVARLIVKDLALITKTVDLDTRCGFGNFMAQVSEFLDLSTVIDLVFGEPQTIAIPAEACSVGGDMFPIFEDCLGTEYLLDGVATFTGTKTVTGELALDDTPLHPQDRRSAFIEIEQVVLSEVTPYELPPEADDFEPHLTLHDGRLAGSYFPVTGEAADAPGAYFIVIPVGEFRGVRLFDSDVTLHSGAMSFPMHVDDSDLYAFTGGFLDEVNWLYGTLTVDGTTWEIGAQSQPIALDPEYDQAQFDLSYECIENLEEVVPVDP